MTSRPLKHVRDSFDTAMRMIREAAQRTLERIVEGEVVEEQEGIEFVADARGDGTEQTHARTFNGGLWVDSLGDGSEVGHVGLDEVRVQSITYA